MGVPYGCTLLGGVVTLSHGVCVLSLPTINWAREMSPFSTISGAPPPRGGGKKQTSAIPPWKNEGVGCLALSTISGLSNLFGCFIEIIVLFHLCCPRFASTSPLKPIPHRPPVSGPASVRKSFSMKEKEGFFKCRTSKKPNKETTVSIVDIWENVPLLCPRYDLPT